MIVMGNDAVDLTTRGFEGIVMERPDRREKCTKVIIFYVLTYLNHEGLPSDDRFVWTET